MAFETALYMRVRPYAPLITPKQEAKLKDMLPSGMKLVIDRTNTFDMSWVFERYDAVMVFDDDDSIVIDVIEDCVDELNHPDQPVDVAYCHELWRDGHASHINHRAVRRGDVLDLPGLHHGVVMRCSALHPDVVPLCKKWPRLLWSHLPFVYAALTRPVTCVPAVGYLWHWREDSLCRDTDYSLSIHASRNDVRALLMPVVGNPELPLVTRW